MKIWIDTEFTTFKGSLISLGMIDENNETFYEVIEFPETECHDWVKQNVLPLLGQTPVSKEMFEYRFYKYISKYNELHVIADWPDDIKYFCEILHTRPGECLNIPNTTTFEITRRLDYKSEVEHHALHDAIGIKEAWLAKYGKKD
jgi:hypothetical protein